MPKDRIYLAYGSNLNLDQMAHRCPTAKLLGATELKGYELLFKGKPLRAVATIEPKTNASVPVLLWKLRTQDEVSLDKYEGVPTTYAKQTIEVEFRGKPIAAMTYIMTPGHRAGIPSAEYLNRIAVGYDLAGFDEGVLTHALERSGKAMRRELELFGQHAGPQDLHDLRSASLAEAAAIGYEDMEIIAEILNGYPSDAESLPEEQLRYVLHLYTKYQSGMMDWDELGNCCREYLDAQGEQAPEQGSLFEMKWGW